MEVQEAKAIKEEVKEGTRDGTRQEVTKEAQAEVERARDLSPTVNAHAINVEARVTSPRTAQGGQAK